MQVADVSAYEAVDASVMGVALNFVLEAIG
jgi:hypothetical protein